MSLAARTDAAGARPERSTGQFGVVVFLASDVMLFAPFFAAYFLLRATNTPWPAAGVELDVPRAAIATAVLVTSSFTLLGADRAHGRGDSSGFSRWLLITIALGLTFLANQTAEYATLSFSADDHVYGSIYWAITGLHAAHVLAGVSCLGLVFIRSARTAAADEITPWVNGVSLFWHLVDVVWIAVFRGARQGRVREPAEAGGPAVGTNPSSITDPPMRYNQYENALSRGNARSGAPIWSGTK